MKWRWKNRKIREQELGEEIEFDFALAVQQRIEAGATREEAEFAARRDFGNLTRVKEVTRDMWTWTFLERLIQDTRHALRGLRKAPAFTITAVLTLALGIGATTSIFALVYAVLLKSLAVGKPSELYRLGKEARCCYESGYSQKNEFSLVSYDLYKYFRDNTKSFAELAAFEAGQEFLGVRRSGNSEPAQSDRGEFVSGNYFTMFDAQVRQAMASVDPNLPVLWIATLKEHVANQFRQNRLIARLTSLFGILSLVLSSIGLYGVTAYNAESRTSELGVRMALGANRGDIVSLVLRGAFTLIAVGLIIGLPLTFAAGKFLGSQLYGVDPYNPIVVFIAVVTLGLSALIASLIPALRSSWISPLEALRSE